MDQNHGDRLDQLERRVRELEQALERRVGELEQALIPNEDTFYAVARGTRTGVYRTAEEATAQTRHFRHALMRVFHTLEEAEAFIAVNIVLPPPPEPVYAVAWGINPGIYATHEQATAQITTFHNGMMRRFPTREEAEVFIAANRDPELLAQPLSDTMPSTTRSPDGRTYLSPYPNITKRSKS